jgi:hypothetical protein
LILGPLKESYNGDQTNINVHPVNQIKISNCDFGSPVVKDQPFFLHNVRSLSLDKVVVDNQAVTAILSSKDQMVNNGA